MFDGQGLVDWAAVAGDGGAFAWIKATQGTYDVQSNWAGAARAGIARGAYHFFDPTEDGAAQAERFLATVGQLEPGDLPPMVDIECPSGASSCLYAGASGNAAPAEITSRLWAFVRGVEVATSRKPVLYTYEAYFSANALDTAGFGAYYTLADLAAAADADTKACNRDVGALCCEILARLLGTPVCHRNHCF